MEKDMVLDAMLAQQWKNGACRGYVIWAMENCGKRPMIFSAWFRSFTMFLI